MSNDGFNVQNDDDLKPFIDNLIAELKVVNKTTV
jgi:hypothetical protein